MGKSLFGKRFSFPSRPGYLAGYIGAALIFLWPLVLHPQFAPARPTEAASDFLLTHLPNALYIRQSLQTYGQLPLWNTQILAGQPFVADPLAGLWYPPNLLLFILPLPFAFNVLLVIHIALLGFGMFRLLIAEGLPPAPAFFGGLLLAGTPKLIAHLGAGHITLVFAFAWIPWALLASRQLVLHGGVRRGAMLGSLFAFMILLDSRWGIYVIFLSVAFGLTRWAGWRLKGQSGAAWSGLWRGVLSAGIFTAALSAVLLLPFAEFVRLSGRASLTFEEAGAYSLPLYPYLLGMVVPLYGVVHEWVTYFGAVAFGLALVGLYRRPWFWLILVVFSMLFALGVHGPLFPWLFRWVPGLSFLRAPSRVWLFVALGVSVLAAYGLTTLSELILPRLRLHSRLARWIPPERVVMAALCVAALVEMLVMNASELTARPVPSPSPAATWIASRPGLFRVFSPSGSLPLPDRLQHVEGVSPVHLESVRDFVSRASNIPIEGYSVSVPVAWVEGENPDPELIRLASTPDTRLLGLLNVAYIAVDFPLQSPGLELAKIFGRTRIYRNTEALPRAWTETGPAEIVYWSPNRIEVQVVGPGRLTLSEIAYPGWKAWVDEAATPIETVEGLLRSVRLSPGSHSVVFTFQPMTFYIGLAITLGGVLALIGIWLREKESGFRRGSRI